MLEVVLKSKAEVKVLGVVLYEDGLHLREIARKAGVSSSEAHRELASLQKIGLLFSTRRGNQLLFYRNNRCTFLNDVKNLYQKTEGIFGRIKAELDKLDGVKYAFIFGSSARGKEKQHSDVDLMVIGDVEDSTLADKLFKVQKAIGLEINFILWTMKDLKEKAESDNGFLKTIMKNEKIFLKGDEDEFIGFVKKRPNTKS